MYNLVDIHFHTDDSFDAFPHEIFDVEKLIEILKDNDDNKSVKLLCKTDHNILNFNKYFSMAQKFDAAGITLLPGIEINSKEDVHWLFIFDNLIVNQGIPEDDDYWGQVLDSEINKYFGYDISERDKSLKKQAEEAQKKSHDLKKFIEILHKLNIPYIAIPHLNKTKGWYKKLKSDNKQLLIVEEFLNSNIVNGFESKNQDDFIYTSIQDTETHIKHLQQDYDKYQTTLTDEARTELTQSINRRLEHLKKLIELNKSVTSGDVALIYGSDFHCTKRETIESYRSYKDKLFYMKAENTFEGLRISLLDQYSRIFSVKRKTKFSKEAVICIDKLKIAINGKDVIINLGDGLNSIIGARGTGKSYFLNMLIGKTEKYNGSSISKDISLKEIIFSNGDKKPCLDSSVYDILTQRGTSTSKEKSENSIYGLLADAPYKMEAYLKEIEGLSQSKEEKESIKSNIDELNDLLDMYIRLNDLRHQSIDFSYIKTYNEFYSHESDSIRIYELFNNTKSFISSELQRLDTNLSLINDTEKHISELISDINKLSKIKELSALSIDFANEKEVLDKFRNGKLDMIKPYLLDKQQKLQDALLKVEICLNIIHDKSTNTVNVLNHNIDELKDFIDKSVGILKLIRAHNINLLEQFSTSSKDEVLYNLDVGRSKYYIKTVTELNFLNLNQTIFASMFNKYRISYMEDILVKCLNIDDYGKYYISQVLETLDKRYRNHYIEMPVLEKQLFLDFNNGEFKNWAALSPGERADKLLDIVLNGNSGKILLIDQPEDDLDNETIYRTLVYKIRELKLRRQIIAVTHNANVAITGDSDVLIVCQNANNNFSCIANGIESLNTYSYSSINSKIENQKILLIAAEILDGGKEALRKRVRKIGYKDIFYKEEV